MAKPKPITNVTEGQFNELPRDSDGGLKAFMTATGEKFKDIETLTKAILFVAAISLVGVVVAVIGLVVDQMHFNNETYVQQAARNQETIDQLRVEVRTLRNQNDQIDRLIQAVQQSK
jgi:hypothetical protein